MGLSNIIRLACLTAVVRRMLDDDRRHQFLDAQVNPTPARGIPSLAARMLNLLRCFDNRLCNLRPLPLPPRKRLFQLAGQKISEVVRCLHGA